MAKTMKQTRLDMPALDLAARIRAASNPHALSRAKEIEDRQRRVIREEPVGMRRHHIRKLARAGWRVLLGDLIYGNTACAVCRSTADDENMLLCDGCDKGYHMHCLRPLVVTVPEGDWFCTTCCDKQERAYEAAHRRFVEHQASILQFFSLTRGPRVEKAGRPSKRPAPPKRVRPRPATPPSDELVSELGTDSDEDFVPGKRRRPAQRRAPVARRARDDAPAASRITAHFRPSPSPTGVSVPDASDEGDAAAMLHCSLAYQRPPFGTRQQFRLPRPSVCPRRRVTQMLSLAAAMESKGIGFADDLVYSSACPRALNCAARDRVDVQPMTAANASTFRKFKEMGRSGLWPPLMVEKHPVQGFVVRADGRIPDRTLICEYVGEVDVLANRDDADSDSIMDLLHAEDPAASLVIVPDRRGNVARFLSGINNSDPASRKQRNIKSARFELDGQVRVVLYANRDIAKGELLHYDYNGLLNNYPTEHFS